ncbi:M20 metallopeptidase family protein [Subtercola endophyticus]|uniref:M20 metallopeptidase family protein n=1 Tax=Subtercola endophyticus TaxID=2895559 RepID=UPI001E58313C|nr:M20 family metallopeptidase [Subtercola endophyticus]UFS60175.1 M20 family metallopeptidase [Subtercola endophyticus]
MTLTDPTPTTPATTAPTSAALRAGSFFDDAQRLLPDLVRLRRSIHADPEVGLDLPRTQRRVLDALGGLGLEISTGIRTTSVIAVLRGGRPGPVVLLRGDMDALPVVEQTGLEFASTNGAMHACGHDLHTAALVGAARLLADRREELAGDVLFMFQPGEEGAGGAQVMLEEGLLDAAGQKPIAAYALHVGPGPRGLFATKPGAFMAGSSELRVAVQGRGGHGSQPQAALDPVPVAAEIVLALQTFATRRFNAFDPVVITVTQLNAGSEAINVIPETATLAATIRTISAASVEVMQAELPRLIGGIAEAHGCSATVEFEVHYPVAVNDPATTAGTVEVLREVFGDQRVIVAPTPAMSSEDFAYVLDEVPGSYVFLLASPAGLEASPEINHSPRVMFDDAVLADAATALAQLAWSKLGTA